MPMKNLNCTAVNTKNTKNLGEFSEVKRLPVLLNTSKIVMEVSSKRG